MTLSQDELKQAIKLAFASVPRPGTGHISHCVCDECAEVRSAFGDSNWQNVDVAVIDANFDKLPLLSVDAFHHFLPAFLLRSLDTPESMVWEFTFYTITTRSDDWFLNRVRGFSREQVTVIIEFLNYMRTQFEDLGHWLATDKVINKRVMFWQSLLQP